jgi:hypothetical protein
MAIADGGHLTVLGPGVRTFGEDREIDRLIRRYGYRTSGEILELVNRQADLQANLSAAAHLIHGSSEERFRITYAAGHLSADEIRSVGYESTDCRAALDRYAPERLQDGWNELDDGERIFFIRNPALGLWAHASRMESSPQNG